MGIECDNGGIARAEPAYASVRQRTPADRPVGLPVGDFERN